MTFRQRRVPCIALAHVLAGSEAQPVPWRDTTLVLIRLATDEIFALAVDRVHDHEDVVVKPIPPAIMDTGIYAGTTLLDDGRPMMLLDVPNIASDCGMLDDLRAGSESLVEEASAEPDKPRVPVMLFTGLDQRRRAVRLDLVQRIDTVEREAIDLEGARAQVVIEDRLFALVGHDSGALPEGPISYTHLTLPTKRIV